MEKTTVVNYLIKRLVDLGITDIFGVPGDYNFHIVDAVEENVNTKWIGCCNELNAGYAADGYARIRGMGAVVTTFGVGELSAVNAIAGSFSESLPVIMIVGSPNTSLRKNHAIIHHTLGNGDFDFSQKIYKNITAATALLSPGNAVSEIERVLSVAVNEKKPVYISVPVDVCDQTIIEEPKPFSPKISDQNVLYLAVDKITDLLNKSVKPVIIAEAGVLRNQIKTEVEQLIKKSGYPAATMFMGKGAVDETLPNYIGLYDGELINPAVRDIVESSDCLLVIGALMTEYNTGLFTAKLDPAKVITIDNNSVIVGDSGYDNVLMKDMVTKLSEKLKFRKELIPHAEIAMSIPSERPDSILNAEYMYPRIQEFLQPGDIVIAESCTLFLGFAQIRMPRNTWLCSQALWGSIGWSTPAAFGAAVAERNRRVILLTGEGSHQLTVQEIGSIFRHGLKPVIIVLNNKGYTIERLLSANPEDAYNDIANWNYSKLPEVFGGDAFVAQARTNGEFDKALRQATQEQSNRLCYIEAFTDKMDAPPLAKAMHKIAMERKMT